MDSKRMTVQDLFQTPRQYAVPFYQRQFVWNLEEQWKPLWEDLAAKADARVANPAPDAPRTPHFMGALVLEPRDQVLVGVNTMQVIDGQQRLTTLQYMVWALYLVLQDKRLSQLAQIVYPHARNLPQQLVMNHPEIEQFKVYPSLPDRAVYLRAMGAPTFEALAEAFPEQFTTRDELRKKDASSGAVAAIWFFGECFSKWIGDDATLEEARANALVYALLQDLVVVSILLGKDDDPQVIFETLNARGKELDATDLIRNYLFMIADRDVPGINNHAQALYDRYWAQLNGDYWKEGQTRGRLTKPRLEWMIHGALQAETREEVDLQRLYTDYRRFAAGAKPPLTAEAQLIKLTAYATHYQQLVDGIDTTPIGRFGKRIAGFDITTVYPLALAISMTVADEKEKVAMYGVLLSYLVRRAICGLTPKNYNNVFMATLKHLHQKGWTAAVLGAYLASQTTENARWPKDQEFESACKESPLYPGNLDAPKTRAVLTELEAYLRATVKTEEPALPVIVEPDIDHILPKAWRNHWPLADGTTATEAELNVLEAILRAKETLDPRQTMLHAREWRVPTLGNLTLLNLGVNRSVQDEAFKVKREQLFAHTALRLNVAVAALPAWDESTIDARGATLAAAALVIWPGPPAATTDGSGDSKKE